MKAISESDFTEGTEFIIKEFDVPITYSAPGGWFNWISGTPKEYDPSGLSVTNHDKVTFREWIEAVESHR